MNNNWLRIPPHSKRQGRQAQVNSTPASTMRIYSIVFFVSTTLLASVSNASLARDTTMTALNYSSEVQNDVHTKRLLRSTSKAKAVFQSTLSALKFQMWVTTASQETILESLLTHKNVGRISPIDQQLEAVKVVFQEKNLLQLAKIAKIRKEVPLKALKSRFNDEVLAQVLIDARMSSTTKTQDVVDDLWKEMLQSWYAARKSNDGVIQLLRPLEKVEKPVQHFHEELKVAIAYIQMRTKDNKKMFDSLIEGFGAKRFYPMMGLVDLEYKNPALSKFQKLLFEYLIETQTNPLQHVFTAGQMENMGLKLFESPMFERLYLAIHKSEKDGLKTHVMALREATGDDDEVAKLILKQLRNADLDDSAKGFLERFQGEFVRQIKMKGIA